jgi:hypothetical protein
VLSRNEHRAGQEVPVDARKLGPELPASLLRKHVAPSITNRSRANPAPQDKTRRDLAREGEIPSHGYPYLLTAGAPTPAGAAGVPSAELAPLATGAAEVVDEEVMVTPAGSVEPGSG